MQESKWVGYQGSLDYQGADFTASVTLANPNLFDGSAVGVAQYLQAMTPQSVYTQSHCISLHCIYTHTVQQHTI